MRFFKFKLLFLCSLWLFQCKSSIEWEVKHEIKDPSLKDIVEKADSLFKEKEGLIVYVKLYGSEDLIEVKDYNKWPDDIEITYNVLIYDDKPLLYKEIPYIESGDFKNIYTYYFDESLNVVATKFISIFFDSGCVEGALSKEVVRYYQEERMIDETIAYYDTNQNTVEDPSKCSENYELNLNLEYYNYSDTPIAKTLD